MTAFEPTASALRGERASFVPTTFFAEFLAGAREGLDIQARCRVFSRQCSPQLAKF